MADILSTAPALSTPDNHILTQVEPAAQVEPSCILSDEQLKFRYEIERAIREIREHDWKRVALQFPDYMLGHSARVYQMLSRGLSQTQPRIKDASSQASRTLETAAESLDISDPPQPVKLTILADTPYGSCCVDEIAAEHVNADAVIHYGRACLSPTARLPVVHIFTLNELDHTAAIESFTKAHPDLSTNIILTADTPYSSHIQPLHDSLLSKGYVNLHAAEIIHSPSSPIPNRTLPASVTEDASTLSQWHLYHISEPPTSLLLTLASKTASIQIYPTAPSPPTFTPLPTSATSLLLRRRYALLTSLSTATTWGILLNTLSVNNYLALTSRLQRLLALKGRKSYLFVVGKLSPAKLSNFAEIEGWVVVGCWESSLIDSREFFRPILTPFELELALKRDEERVWTGEWRADFASVLQHAEDAETMGEDVEGRDDGPEPEGEGNWDEEEESAPPEFDLRTGKYVSRSSTRPSRRHVASTTEGAGTREGGSSRSLTKRPKGDMVSVNGVPSTGATYLAEKRTWKGLGSDFEIKYDDSEEVVEGSLIEEGRSGVARGYTVGDSNRT